MVTLWGYNPSKDNVLNFVNEIGPVIDHYMPKYDNFLILGDFNSEMSEDDMRDFSETYNLSNLINERTCFKNPCNPSLIDLILTNRPRSFQDSQVIETGLSDHHKMTITVLRAFLQKQTPITIKYRDYKKFDQSLLGIHGTFLSDWPNSKSACERLPIGTIHCAECSPPRLSNASGYNGSGGTNATSACLESNIHMSLKPSGMKIPANKAQPIPAFVPFAVEVDAEADSVSILNELSALHDHSSDINEDSTESPSPNPNDNNDEIGPLNTLKKTRVSNINRLIIGHLNINSLRNKIEAPKSVINGNIDILVITETKIDQSFPICQFFIEGYSPPFRLDRDVNGGGVIIYVKEDIPVKLLKDHATPKNVEGIFLEINLKHI